MGSVLPRKLNFVPRHQAFSRGDAFKLGIAVGFATLPLTLVFGIPVFAIVSTVLDRSGSGLTLDKQAMISLLLIADAVIGGAIFYHRRRIASIQNYFIVSIGVGAGVVAVNVVIVLTEALSLQSVKDILGVIVFPPFIGVGIALLLGLLIRICCPVRVVDTDCCDQCGYELTGNVTGRCPECGTPCMVVPVTE